MNKHLHMMKRRKKKKLFIIFVRFANIRNTQLHHHMMDTYYQHQNFLGDRYPFQVQLSSMDLVLKQTVSAKNGCMVVLLTTEINWFLIISCFIFRTKLIRLFEFIDLIKRKNKFDWQWIFTLEIYSRIVWIIYGIAKSMISWRHASSSITSGLKRS